MNKTKIDVDELCRILQIYKQNDGTLTIHMIEKIIYHFGNHGEAETIEHGL